MASYDKTQPQDDEIKVSRAKLVANSGAIEEYIARDHVSFDANTTNSGLHNQITCIKKTTDPTTAVNLPQAYSKDLGGNDNLVFKAGNDGNIAHLSGIKAWVSFTISSTFVITILASHNVTSVVRPGGFTITVSFTDNMIDTNYATFIIQSTNVHMPTSKTTSDFSFTFTAPTLTQTCNILVIGN